MRRLGIWPPIAVLVAGGGCAETPPPVVTWAEIVAQPAPPPGERIAYGPDSVQFGELRLPAGTGPFALVVVIHGGCWQAAYGMDHVAPLAEALRREGFATWAIEYRRLGDPGGGWPGTFADAARALSHVRVLAETRPLDLDRVVLLGHSAGGHLALWLASRGRLPASSAFAPAGAPRVRGVVALAGIVDLAAYGAGTGSCNASVHPLMGGAPDEVPGRYAEADPVRLLPPAAPARLVHGAADPIVPLAQGEAYARAAGAAGGDVRLVRVESAGHFDLIAPFAPAWRTVLEQVQEVASGPNPATRRRPWEAPMSDANRDPAVPLALLRAALKSQYHAGLRMLRLAIEACPDDLWAKDAHRNAFWLVAYHVLFYTHFYLEPHADDFRPWERHRPEVQYMSRAAPGGAGEEGAGRAGDERLEPYSKRDLLEYWEACDARVDAAVDALDLTSPESGFYWYAMSKVEHQMLNLRHLGHHAGQLYDRVRSATGRGVDWVGGTSADAPA